MNSNNMPAFTCIFCLNPRHGIRVCPRLDDYIQLGKCIQDADGWASLPNNMGIPRYFLGRCLMEKIDNYWKTIEIAAKTNNPHDIPPHIMSNLYEIATDAQISSDIANYHYQLAYIEDASNEDDRPVSILKNEGSRKEKRKKVVFDGIDMPARPYTGVPRKAIEPMTIEVPNETPHRQTALTAVDGTRSPQAAPASSSQTVPRGAPTNAKNTSPQQSTQRILDPSPIINSDGICPIHTPVIGL
ncbi:hypothetical protein Hypma_008150 [Hypsizygus marmoreus]|uniref:Uncharacterized protein n=1 Tax=Hypsizygus marmoreus TaxID=39966 RepID=A0A369JQZ6_HYPMA|nr:hypothetical protein Hypma_008150 [Hypsizygus marmoreus]